MSIPSNFANAFRQGQDFLTRNFKRAKTGAIRHFSSVISKTQSIAFGALQKVIDLFQASRTSIVALKTRVFSRWSTPAPASSSELDEQLAKQEVPASQEWPTATPSKPIDIALADSQEKRGKTHLMKNSVQNQLGRKDSPDETFSQEPHSEHLRPEISCEKSPEKKVAGFSSRESARLLFQELPFANETQSSIATLIDPCTLEDSNKPTIPKNSSEVGRKTARKSNRGALRSLRISYPETVIAPQAGGAPQMANFSQSETAISDKASANPNEASANPKEASANQKKASVNPDEALAHPDEALTHPDAALAFKTTHFATQIVEAEEIQSATPSAPESTHEIANRLPKASFPTTKELCFDKASENSIAQILNGLSASEEVRPFPLTKSEPSDSAQLKKTDSPLDIDSIISDQNGICENPNIANREISDETADQTYQKVLLPTYRYDSLADCLRNSVARMLHRGILISYLNSEDGKKIYQTLSNCLTNKQWHPVENNNTQLWSSVLNEIRYGCVNDDQVNKQLAYHLYRNLPVLPFAKEVLCLSQFLSPCQFAAEPNTPNTQTYSEQLREVCRRIDNYHSTWRKWFEIQVKKVGSKFNYMDANMHNTPFFAGTFEFQKANQRDNVEFYQQLRYPTPTVENLNSSITISPEYRCFLDEVCLRGERVLYSNHQSPFQVDEKNRIEVLKAQVALYPENFYMVTFPVLSKIESRHCVNIGAYCNFLQDLFVSPEVGAKYGFYFSENIKIRIVEESAKKWTAFLKEHLIDEEDIQDATLRVTYVSLLQSLVRRDLAIEKQISFCNNTCKDAIDRGAIHLFLDVYWAILMSGKEKSQATLDLLTTLTVYPAFAAKKQAILPKRLAQILSFAEKIESLNGEKIENIRSAWIKTSGLKNINFRFESEENPVQGAALYEPVDTLTVEGRWNQFNKDLRRAKKLRFSNQDWSYTENNSFARQKLEETFKAIVDREGIPQAQFDDRLSMLGLALSQAPFALAISQVLAYAHSTLPNSQVCGFLDERSVELVNWGEQPISERFKIIQKDDCKIMQARQDDVAQEMLVIRFEMSFEVDVKQHFTATTPTMAVKYKIYRPEDVKELQSAGNL